MRRGGDKTLARGDVVEVRSATEILATLDGQASTDNIPFMPEMLKYAGKRFTVSCRVEKICDTVTGGMAASRRMYDTVFLEDLRCDGSAHGGCQAGCRIYWKESWLRRMGSETEERGRSEEPGDTALAKRATSATTLGGRGETRGDDKATVYRCQATEAVHASEPLNPYDGRQYVREIMRGNVTLWRFLRVAIRALTFNARRLLRLGGWTPVGHARQPVRATESPDSFDLKIGDVVEVLSPEAIRETLDASGKSRGLWFDWEMLPYCGKRFRVKDKVQRIIDERSGRMIEIKSDCLILDGVVCSGDHSSARWFCPRGIYPYWRESWVHPVRPPADKSEDTMHAPLNR